MKREPNSEKKVLVVATAPLCGNGLTSVLMTLARIVRERYPVDFALGEGAELPVRRELETVGAVYDLPERKRRTGSYMMALGKLVKAGGYTAIHIHGNSATMALDLIAARKAPIRMTHCHNREKQPEIKRVILGSIMNRLVTHPVACSQMAGEAIYTRPFTVIPNGVDTVRFRFSAERRSAVRERLGLQDAFVIGHIGWFNRQKNQARLVGIMAEVLKMRPGAVLLLCGKGEEEKRVRSLFMEAGMANQVRFLGEVSAPEELMAAMDVLVLPSLFEGLPLTGIEAQASGLPCIFSDTITQEADVSGKVRFLPLSAPDRTWAEALCEARAEDREDAAVQVRLAGFDRETVRERVMELYAGAMK